MQFLAKCSVEEAKKYNGKLVIPNEDSKKVDKVFLNIEVHDSEELEEAYRFTPGLVKCITSWVKPMYCPEAWKGNVFCAYSYENDVVGKDHTDGVKPLLIASQGYCNMRDIYNISLKTEDLRVIGGCLLDIEGINIGRYNSNKGDSTAVFDGMYDTFVEINIEDLENLQEIASKVRKKVSESDIKEKKSKDGKSSKPKSIGQTVNKRKETLNKLFGSEEVDF